MPSHIFQGHAFRFRTHVLNHSPHASDPSQSGPSQIGPPDSCRPAGSLWEAPLCGSRIPIDILMLLLGSIHEPGRTIPWAVSESLTEGPRLLDPRTRLDLQLLVEVRARNCTLERGPSCWWPVIQFQKFLNYELQRFQPCFLDINRGPQEQQIRVHLPYVSCNRVEVYQL